MCQPKIDGQGEYGLCNIPMSRSETHKMARGGQFGQGREVRLVIRVTIKDNARPGHDGFLPKWRIFLRIVGLEGTIRDDHVAQAKHIDDLAEERLADGDSVKLERPHSDKVAEYRRVLLQDSLIHPRRLFRMRHPVIKVHVLDVFEEFLGNKRWFGDGTTEIDVVLL